MAFEGKSEAEAREEILSLVSEYCDSYHNQGKPFAPGDRISYASRVYDHSEMVNLVDASLDFWQDRGPPSSSAPSRATLACASPA